MEDIKGTPAEKKIIEKAIPQNLILLRR